jgi:hypothetical protein
VFRENIRGKYTPIYIGTQKIKSRLATGKDCHCPGKATVGPLLSKEGKKKG